MNQSTTPEEVLKNFSKDFQQGFINDPFVNKVVYMIRKGVNPYEIIEQLLISHVNICNDYAELLIEGPAPKTIVVSEIQFEKLKTETFQDYVNGSKPIIK